MTTPSPAIEPPGHAAQLDAAAAVGAWLQEDFAALRAVIEQSEQPRELVRCLVAMAGLLLLTWPTDEMRSSFLAGCMHAASDPEAETA